MSAFSKILTVGRLKYALSDIHQSPCHGVFPLFTTRLKVSVSPTGQRLVIHHEEGKGMFRGKKRRGSGKEADGEDDGALDPASGSSPAAPGEAASASSNPRPNPRPEGQSGGGDQMKKTKKKKKKKGEGGDRGGEEAGGKGARSSAPSAATNSSSASHADADEPPQQTTTPRADVMLPERQLSDRGGRGGSRRP